MKILLADDDESVRDAVSSYLRSKGDTLDIVTDGQYALDKLMAGGTYDLLITDNQMPLLSGLELLRRIKSDVKLSSLPVIVLTGDKIEERVQRLGGIFAYKGKFPDSIEAAMKKAVPGEFDGDEQDVRASRDIKRT